MSDKAIERVIVREVGPRDGLQMAKTIMTTDAKRAWIAALVRAGLTQIEVASFVPPASLPQMADAPELVRAVRADHPGLHVVSLAPNLRGAQNAAAAGAQSILVPVSASEAHSRSNVRRTRDEQLAEFARIVEWKHSLGDAAPRIEAGIATSFGCSLQGDVPEDDVIRLAADLARAGADSIALADTLGYAKPRQIRGLVRAVRAEIGRERFGNLHLHDTMGVALANVLAGLEEGVRGFDAALGGLGGCPFAPGSVGNVASEDLVYLLESEGFDTGIDLAKYLQARDALAQGLPDEKLHGRVAAAGIPRTYKPARDTVPAEPVKRLPLEGVKVLEFTHMIMGPSCGMVLGDLGADVIKIEPSPDGDNTRRLLGSAIGFFPSFNRNKRSLCVDLKSKDGLALVKKLAASADVVLENFRPGAMDKLGLGPAALIEANPRLIYCSCKGFLPGPYEHRAALDEVVQMMGGLAYMTGPPGRPLRAGASINDILGGMFATIAVLAALREREATGKGGHVQSGLFETNTLLMGPHMAASAIVGRDLPSFADPKTIKPWTVYDVFDTEEAGQQVFVGVVTETQWQSFCKAFGLQDLLDDPGLATQALRVVDRSRFLPRIAEVFRAMTKAELMDRCEALGLSFAQIARPSEMLTDPHLLASGGLMQTDMSLAEGAPGGKPHLAMAGMPNLPVSMSFGRLKLRRQPPQAGEQGVEIMREAGLGQAEIDAMLASGVVTVRG
jgi:crotonobetainyl-CoA:carnitine CoA-transferase CaiB-like acyl-CoA transferase/isopropylmalate/homocitrate/citramalate synthase